MSEIKQRDKQCLLFDWGDTLMRVFPDCDGPMYTWPRVEALPHVEGTLTQLHYEKRGFVARPMDAPGMQYRREG